MSKIKQEKTNTYVFQVELVHEKDGRWSAGIPKLPGCATWGYTKEEALSNIQDAAEAYLIDVKKAGKEIPKKSALEIIKQPVVAVAV